MANLSSKTGFTPVQTQVNFSAVNSATTIQNFAAYDSQELTGFVYVNTTSTGALTLRAAVKVTVNKNGAGTYEVASVDVAGDSVSSLPIVSFSMSGTNLQATLSSSITGTWGSGYIKYQLSAPALGGNFPLTVSASQVQGSVSGSAPTAGYLGEYYAVRNVSDVSLTTTAASVVSQSLTAGVWLIQASVGILSTTNNIGFVNLYQGTTASPIGAAAHCSMASGRQTLAVSWVVTLSSTTTMGVYALVDTGTATANGTRNSFTAVRIA